MNPRPQTQLKKLQNGSRAQQELKTAIDTHGDSDIYTGWDEGGDGKQGVGASALIPTLVKAIQELSAKVEALENA